MMRANDIMFPEVLTKDVTFYVETDGDDANGDGTTAAPFKTVFGALNRISTINPASYSITIQFGKGIWYLDRTIRPNYPFAGSVSFIGNRHNVGSAKHDSTVSNIDPGYTTNPDPGPSGAKLQYFDCDVDLTALTGFTTPDVEVGYFLNINATSGAGTNQPALLGNHEIIAWNSGTDVATIRVWSRLGVSALPTTPITVTGGNVQQTVFKWYDLVDDHGLEVTGGNGGEWQDIVLHGNQNQFDTRRGLRVWNAGSVAPNVRFGIHNFDVGAEVFSGGAVEMPVGFISKIWTKGIVVAANAGVRFNFGSIMNGIGQIGVQCQQSAIVLVNTSYFIGCTDSYCLWAWTGGYIDATSAKCYYGDGAGDICLYATVLGDIIKTSITRSGFTTNESNLTGGRIQS
jgi:hypothetical protein